MEEKVIRAEAIQRPKMGPEGITVIVGYPMDDDGFSRLESHLLSQDRGRFVVIDAPGNLMGRRPYRIESDTYSIGFEKSPNTDLIIPRSDLIEALWNKPRDVAGSHRNNNEGLERLGRYYRTLRESSSYTQHGGGMSVRTPGRLTFGKMDGTTRAYHTFPAESFPVFVNGAALPRGHKSSPLGNVAALTIGEDIKIIYADNTHRESIA